MTSRENVKALIDQLPEDQLVRVEAMLRHHLNPPKPRPEVEAMRLRTQTYREQVMRRFRETGKPGTCGVGIMGGSGSFGEHEGMSYGRQGFNYWDGKALIHQSLQYFDGREIEVMERLSISESGSLCCAIELASGGKSVQHADEFPLKAS
jgi:hypothetical protein